MVHPMIPTVLNFGSGGPPSTARRISRWSVAFDLILEVQIRQPRAVQQHDLPLGLAEEAEDALAVKL